MEKLFRRISRKDRERLLLVVETLLRGDTRGRDIKKIVGTDFYRLRSGRYRILYHWEKKHIVVDTIVLRSESTYRHF